MNGTDMWRRLRRAVGDFSRRLAGWFDAPAALADPQGTVAFTVSVVALAAKMAKADGRVCACEEAAFDRLFTVPPHERRNLRRLFAVASATVAGYETYARRIARLFRHRPETLENVLDALFHIATADGVVHPAEMRFLERVAEIFRIGARFRCIRARHVTLPEDAPYDVLGVNPCDDEATIRRAWRRLVRDNHPDRLQARGVPEQMLRLANERMAAINAAFEAIRHERAAAGHEGVASAEAAGRALMDGDGGGTAGGRAGDHDDGD